MKLFIPIKYSSAIYVHKQIIQDLNFKQISINVYLYKQAHGINLIFIIFSKQEAYYFWYSTLIISNFFFQYALANEL